MAMKKTASANLTQALGATIIELTESGFTSQITVGGTATSGTIAFEYRNNGTWFTLDREELAVVCKALVLAPVGRLTFKAEARSSTSVRGWDKPVSTLIPACNVVSIA